MGSTQVGLSADAPRARVAYVMSRFPRLTETFVLAEIIGLERLGFAVEVFPLLRERAAVAHAEASRWVARAHYAPFLSWRVLRDQLHTFARKSAVYLGTLAQVLLRTLPSPNYLAGAVLFFPKSVHFAREMERRGVTHVHAHFANHPALAALIVHRLTGIPFSFTAHGSDLHVDQTALAWKLEQAAFAVTVSEYNRAFVGARVGAAAAARLRVIHCGIDPAQHVREREVEGATLEILCVAALRGVKGHHVLLEACRRLAERGVPFRCHLVGDGPLEARIRARIERDGLASRVLLHGPLARERVLERMRLAHVVVLASVQDRAGRREGIPVTLMEAMSCALPVVASRLSGIPELVTHERSGLLFEPGDAGGLAAALERLWREPELRARLGREARATVVEGFALERGVLRLAEEIRRAGASTERRGAPVATSGPSGR